MAPTPIGRADDPLGVRGDFPIVKERIFLNSAYIAPIPLQVVTAGHAFLEEKARRSCQLGPLLEKCDEVRARFARLIRAASPDEIGLLFSTAEGENVVAAGLGLKAGDNVVIDELHSIKEVGGSNPPAPVQHVTVQFSITNVQHNARRAFLCG